MDYLTNPFSPVLNLLQQMSLWFRLQLVQSVLIMCPPAMIHLQKKSTFLLIMPQCDIVIPSIMLHWGHSDLQCLHTLSWMSHVSQLN